MDGQDQAKLEELHKSVNAEVNKIIKAEAEAAVEEAAVDEKFKAAVEEGAKQEAVIKELEQELHQFRDRLRQEKCFRDEINVRIDHSEAEILHHQQTFTKFLAAVDSKKLAMAQVLRSPGKSFDDLIQTMERLKLEVNNSRRAAEEKESKLSGEREAKMESLIEEYQAAEEEIEELKSLLEESKLANEETGEEVSKAIAEEKELKGSLESRAKQLEELKREVQEQESESQAARRELEGKTEEGRKRLQTVRREKSQMAVKLAETEAATLRKKQELARLSGLADLDKVQLREEQEKERKVKENCQKLAELIKNEAEKIERLERGIQDTRSKGEQERNLMKEKLRKAVDETTHLEKEVTSLSNVEQQADTLQQEKSNLLARSKLLQGKNSNYLEDANSSRKRLESAEGTRRELTEKLRIVGEEKENLKKEEESLTQDLKCLGEETLKTKVNVESQENELNNILEVLKNAQSHFDDLLSEEKSMKDRVLTLKAEIGDKKKETDGLEEEKERLTKEKKIVEEKLKLTLAENSAASKQLLGSSEMIETRKKDLAEAKEKQNEKLQEIEKIKEEEAEVNMLLVNFEKQIREKSELLKSSEEEKMHLEVSLEKVKKKVAAKSEAVDNVKIRDEIHEAENSNTSLKKDLEKSKDDLRKVREEEEGLIIQIEEGDKIAKSQTEKFAELKKETDTLSKARLQAKKALAHVSKAVDDKKTASKTRRAEAEVIEKEKRELQESIDSLKLRKEELLQSFRDRLEKMEEEQGELVRPWEEKREKLIEQLQEVTERLEIIDVKMRTKNAIEEKERLVKEAEKRALIEEKRNIEKETKKLHEKLNFPQVQPASCGLDAVGKREGNFQQRGRVKRKLYEPQNPYSFTEKSSENKSKLQVGSTKDRRMKGARSVSPDRRREEEERMNQFDFLT